MTPRSSLVSLVQRAPVEFDHYGTPVKPYDHSQQTSFETLTTDSILVPKGILSFPKRPSQRAESADCTLALRFPSITIASAYEHEICRIALFCFTRNCFSSYFRNGASEEDKPRSYRQYRTAGRRKELIVLSISILSSWTCDSRSVWKEVLISPWPMKNVGGRM